MALFVKSLGFLFYGNVVFTVGLYVYLLKTNKQTRLLYGTNLATIFGGFIAIISGVILIYQFPFQYVTVTIITTMIGMFIGALFGALYSYETLLTGYANGVMMGIMSPMIGAAAKNSIAFLVFLEVLFIFSLFLLVRSVKQ